MVYPQQEIVNLSEKLQVMLTQESTTYRCSDYLGQQSDSLSTTNGNSRPLAESETQKSPVNAMWRDQLCTWAYDIVDHFDLDRETVSVAFSYIDRFVPRYQHHINHKTYQLLAMTALYMAIKIYEPRKVGINSFISLSRGRFTSNHIVAMENVILETLSWNVHPPTPTTFLSHLFLLYPNADPRLGDISRFLAELSVIDYSFVARLPSTIAMACILNAMEEVQVPSHITLEFLESVKRTANIDAESQEVFECQTQLKNLHHAAGYNSGDQDNCMERTVERVDSVSPVCVSKMTPY